MTYVREKRAILGTFVETAPIGRLVVTLNVEKRRAENSVMYASLNAEITSADAKSYPLQNANELRGSAKS